MGETEREATAAESPVVDAGGLGRPPAIKKGAVAAAAAGVVWTAPRVEGLSLRPNYAAAQSTMMRELNLVLYSEESSTTSLLCGEHRVIFTGIWSFRTAFLGAIGFGESGRGMINRFDVFPGSWRTIRDSAPNFAFLTANLNEPISGPINVHVEFDCG